MSKQDGIEKTTIERLVNIERLARHNYWELKEQPWRTVAEISEERQEFLAERRKIIPDITQGIYPFKDIKLSRADVEWLLATHENGYGPVNWKNERQRERMGLDLRGADLSNEDLSKLPLAKCNLEMAQLEGADLSFAQLQGANLYKAHLEGANLCAAFFDGVTKLDGLVLSNSKYGTASLSDIYWGMLI